jgi:hypothetical protein
MTASLFHCLPALRFLQDDSPRGCFTDLTPWWRKNLHLVRHKNGRSSRAGLAKKRLLISYFALQNQRVNRRINFTLMH